MEKIKPTRQLMPGECLPASNYASKDDVSAVANMASCAKQTADTANDRVTALDLSLQNNVTTSHLAADIADVTTANITTGNLSALNANCGNLDNLTVACAASLNCVHINCGSIDNLTTFNITMQNVNADCGDFCCYVATDCVDANSISACCITAIRSCAQDASICCAVICCGNVQNLNVANTVNSRSSCADYGHFACELHAQDGIFACAYAGELTNVITKHDLWPQDVNGTDNYVEINADNGRVMILDENKDWGVIVDNSDTNNIINISNEKNYIDKVYIDYALKPNKVYLHFTTTPSHVYYKADTISGVAPVWYSALPIDPSLATTKAYDIQEQNVVLYDKEIRIKSLDISCIDLELNNLCLCGNLSSDGDICGQIIKANCYFCGNLCGSSDCLGGYTFNEVICCATGDIQSICELIPAAASCSNQLADKNWVNSSISTNTANFMGTYTDVACLPTTGVTNNDYAFVTCCDSGTGTIVYDRYKWTSSDCQWHCEYSLNTSGFTADQLEAINSGITCTLVGKITDVRNSKITICQGASCKGSFTLNQSSNGVISLDGLCKKQYDCAVSAERPLLMTPNTTTGDITDVYISCDKTLSFNPSSGVLTTCCFCGNLSGKATSAECVGHAATNCNCDYNINFNASTGYSTQLISDGCPLTFNPSTGVLSTNVICADEICGAAASACKVNVLGSDVNSYKPVTFTDGVCTDSEIYIQCSCGFAFNPSTGMLKANCFTSAGTIQSGCNTACTSSTTGKPGVQIACGGSIELNGSTPFIDFHVNNACADCSARLIARCGRFDIVATNATGCTAATCTNTFCFCQNGVIYNAKAECEVHNAATDSCDYNNCYKLLFTNADCKAYYSLCKPLWYNPVTGVLCATTICGAVVCATNATKATCAGKVMINGETACGYCDVILKCCVVDSNNYAQLLYGNCCTLKFNPRTGVLCAPYFCGNLCGTASCAENATCAGNATCATTATCACCVVLAKTDVNCSMCVLLKLPSDTTNRIYTSCSSSYLSFNPSTGVLSATKFCGEFSGTVTCATYAQHVCTCATTVGCCYPIALFANQATGNKSLFTSGVCVCYDRSCCKLCADYLDVSCVFTACHLRSNLACITNENNIACEIPTACVTITKTMGGSNVTKTVSNVKYYPYKRRLVISVNHAGQGTNSSYAYQLDLTNAFACICTFSGGCITTMSDSVLITTNLDGVTKTNGYAGQFATARLNCYCIYNYTYNSSGGSFTNICNKHVIQF